MDGLILIYYLFILLCPCLSFYLLPLVNLYASYFLHHTHNVIWLSKTLYLANKISFL